MKHRAFTMSEIGIIAGTRGMAGLGAGLLLADHIAPRNRRALGMILFIAGALSTLPIIAHVLSKPAVDSDEVHDRSMAAT